MASLDSKGEIVPIELPNPEETQLRKGENETVLSPLHSGEYGCLCYPGGVSGIVPSQSD